MIVASETMPINKRGLAISFVFGGFTLANVVGVPIGIVIAEWYGWNATFMLTTLLGGLAFAASFSSYLLDSAKYEAQYGINFL